MLAIATTDHEIHDDRAQRIDAAVPRVLDHPTAGTHTRIVGESVEWRGVLRKSTQVAPTDTTVLITGESGTGKEVVARFIHAASARRNRPFVALNCAALPEQLLESELFGYERGAFTSAQQAKPGQVELASGGVLFLDEVSEMSLSAQAKFLRFLQEREFQRLGGTRLIKANIRVIAATNRDLRKAVERGDFREDLFYRLAVFDIQIPPLRERPSDIVPLSETFLQEIGRSFGRPAAESDARGTSRACPLRVARQRARASQRPGAGSDSLRRRAHRRGTSGPAIRRQVITQRHDRSERTRTHHDCEGPARVPRKQNKGRAPAWVVAHAAPPADPQVRTRGSCHRVIASQWRACVEVHHAAVEANEADHGVDISRCVSTNDRVRTHTPARSSRQFVGEIDGLATCGVARSLPHRLISGRARIARVSGGQPWTSSASAKTRSVSRRSGPSIARWRSAIAAVTPC